MRECFTFFRSFMEGLDGLDDATFRYGLDDEYPEDLNGLEKAVFMAWKASVDISNNRRDSGRKGGKRNEAKSKQTEANDKQIEANGKQIEANAKQTESTITKTITKTKTKTKTKTEKNTYGENGNVKLTAEEYKKLCEDYGEQKTTAAIDFLDLYIGEKDYKTKSHYLTIRRWVMDAVSERKKPPDKKSLDDYMLSVINGGAQ